LLAEALVRLASAPRDLALLGQAARARAMKFDIRTTVRGLEGLYLRL
jgi:hypothetical protein